MGRSIHGPFGLRWVALVAGLGLLVLPDSERSGIARPGQGQPSADAKAEYTTAVRPLVAKYCLDCHSAKAKKGGLDLERFATTAEVAKDVKVWSGVIEQLEAHEMPPKGKPQPTEDERKHLVAWTRGFLDAEARARTGDPGFVPLRRLSNAEYDATVRELTGVDLRPAREFPADGAAGEGFTNAAEALTDISPALFTKYLNAAKDTADRAVLLPDGFRFSPSKTRRDWTDEGTAKLRQFYAAYATGEGQLPIQSYLTATVRYRDALRAGTVTPEVVAANEKLNPKYLGVLWRTLTDKTPSEPLDAVRDRWRSATAKDVPALVAEITRLQAELWRTVKVGNYVQASWNSPDSYVESLARQVAVDPPASESVPLRVAVKPSPGQSDVVVRLAANEPTGGPIVWHRPRLEASGRVEPGRNGPGRSLLLRDYTEYGPAFEIDYPSVFASSAKYLAAAVEAANAPSTPLDELAKKHGIDAAFLRRWVEQLAVEPFTKLEGAKTTPAVPLALLTQKNPVDPARPAITGWRKAGTDLPVLVTNSSDRAEQIPGWVPAHGVAVHPMPKEFVAVAWKSPIAGTVTVGARIKHAHPACGNGVAWWLEHRRDGRATSLGEGATDLGKEETSPVRTVSVAKGDVVVLAVDARDANHVCDMTDISLTVTESGKQGRVWDLAADVADTVLAGNPHADKLGNAGTWAFGYGPSRGGATVPLIPPDSVLGRWRAAASDPKRQPEATKLAEQVQTLLSGPRPANGKSPDRVLYDKLLAVDGPLLAGADLTRITRPSAKRSNYALPKDRFDGAGDITAATDRAVEIRLPAALLNGREFVVEARLPAQSGERIVRVRAGVADGPWNPTVLGVPGGPGYKRLVDGNAEFRRLFPLFSCFPPVVPTDEVVTLKMFHREDEPLARLFLTGDEARRLDRLWAEQRFVSRQPVAEYEYLPQFMGFTTQDTPKPFQQFFIDRKPLFKKHAEAFEAEEAAAVPKQLDALLDFASRAFRRPLHEKEKADLLSLYQTVRGKGATHDEAFRGVLARVLVAPAFLFRIEEAPKGTAPGPVNDWELATRLSYFLWSGPPDAELRKLARAGQLRDPKVLAGQVQRMLKDERTRSLAIEFGTQWIHVRGFDELKEKNEKLFPTFDADLRSAIYEESILFFQDLFRNDRPVTAILDADYAFVNETLAKHYGIPGVTGPQWRRVEGVRQYGRGGVLGLASVQTKEAGASRTSPVLRGNWVVETLLGEKLPKPPPNVPQLPEMEGADKLTTRQLVEKHVSVESCAVCHVRIDPFGFALEKYDPIGRLRDKEVTGLPIDAKSKLKDGTEFEGIDGLRTYLLTKKKDVVTRLFCKRLLGYALGRSVTLSDTALLDDIVGELSRNDGRITTAVQAIVKSPQFRTVRGSDFVE